MILCIYDVAIIQKLAPTRPNTSVIMAASNLTADAVVHLIYDQPDQDELGT